MKRDIFNGKLDKDGIANIIIGLILLGIICLAGGIGFLCVALINEDLEWRLKVLLFVFSGISFGTLIAYPLLTVYAIRTYPRHKKLAHLLWKDYVFSNNVFVQIEEIKLSQNLTEEDWDRIYNLITRHIISCVPSKYIQRYLTANQYKTTIMQYATIADNYCTKNLYSVLKCLMDFTDDPYERELLSLAIKDYSKRNYLQEKTIQFYLQNDPREKKPDIPFCEFINLPRQFGKGDLVVLLGDKQKVAVVGAPYNFDNEPHNFSYDFSDLAYPVYPLDTTWEITEQNLVHIHDHAHYCELARVPSPLKLTPKQEENYKKLLKLLENY